MPCLAGILTISVFSAEIDETGESKVSSLLLLNRVVCEDLMSDFGERAASKCVCCDFGGCKGCPAIWGACERTVSFSTTVLLKFSAIDRKGYCFGIDVILFSDGLEAPEALFDSRKTAPFPLCAVEATADVIVAGPLIERVSGTIIGTVG